MAEILDVWLAKTRIGQLTLLPGDRTFFVFEEEYLNDPNRPVLSQSFFTGSGELIPETRTYKTKLPPFFSNLLPEEYNKVSYDNITNMIWILTGETGLREFIRRLTFTVLIGNGDMHLKNWSFIYSDGVTPELSPAYDFVSTVPYLPGDRLALNMAGEKE